MVNELSAVPLNSTLWPGHNNALDLHRQGGDA